MANEAHVAILRQGVKVWNAWQRANPMVQPDLQGADLRGMNLSEANFSSTFLFRADLSGATLTQAILTRAILSSAFLFKTNLNEANLSEANLSQANLSQANLSQANLSGAFLFRAFLTKADLRGAILNGAILSGTFLSGALLSGATFRQAILSNTILAAVDLRGVHGLETVLHHGPSTIGTNTLEVSQGQIPASFLQGCGVSDRLIKYIPSLTEQSIQFYSCFISYSSQDEGLAKRLYADLQATGVRCWYAPENLKIGESILSGIDQGIRLHDKLLLLLSESSVSSAWVETEVKIALERERNERRRILFPIRIDDAVLTHREGWPTVIRNDHVIGDFRQWKQHDAYQDAFARLLRDLRTD